MSMNDEIREMISPAVEKLSNETGDDADMIFNEFESLFDEYVAVGLSDEDSAKTAIGKVKSSYRNIKRLNLKMMEGCFIGSTESKDANDYNRKQCKTLLDEFIEANGGEESNWKPSALKAGLIDVSGNLLYSQAYINEYRNGNDNLKWMIGKKLDINMRKTAYGMFREYGTEDEYVFYTCYINDPDGFVPEFNKIYKFRAAIKGKDVKNLTLYKSVSKLTEMSTFDMEFIENFLNEQFGDNIKNIEDAYDLDVPMAINPEKPNPRFWITNAIVKSFATTGYGFTDIAVIDQFGGIDTDDVVMKMPDEYAGNIHEGMIGLLVFSPFVRRGKESKGEVEGEAIPSGNILGFIPDPKFSPEFTMEIEEDYQEEY